MNKILMPWIVAIGVLLAAWGALVTTGHARPVLVFLGFAAKHREERLYWCPMHPFYKVKRYGICPYCNMELEPYVAGPGQKEGDPTLVLTPQQVQQAGVRVEKAARRDLVHEIETTAIADLNHESYWHIEFRFEGWVEELFIHNVGETVAKGAPVARVYSPVLFAGQKEYLVAKAANDSVMTESAKRRLELMGIDETEIKALEERKEPSARLLIRSKVAGTIMHVNVKAGMKLPDDGHIADVADLRELWAFADIYDRDVPHAAIGQEARLMAGDRTYIGRIDLVEPRIRAATQSARVRIRVPNDPVTLRPGQFARALIVRDVPKALSVSEHAVIPTGRRDLVILALGGGRFTAREVTLGRSWLTGREGAKDARGLGFFTGHNRYHEVLDGLKEGDEVVTSGAFLLHAETQIRNLIDKMAPEKRATAEVRSAWSGAKLDRTHEMNGLPFASHAEADAYAKSPETSWHKRWPLIRGIAGRAMERYFLINNAIADRKAPLAAEYAEALATEVAPLPKELGEPIDSALAGALRAFAKRLEDAAHGFRGDTQLKDMMRLFGEMSAAYESFIEAFGNPLDRRLHRFICGMAVKQVGSATERWFQPDGDLRNPFGMPGCGSAEKEIR